MLLDKKISIKVGTKVLKYYRELGYDCNLYDEIEIETNHLTKSSRAIVNVECDNCSESNNIKYQDYWKNYSNGNIYLCVKCKHIKYEKTCLDKYSVNNVSKLESIQNKIKQTNKEKWGDENRYNSPKFRHYINNLVGYIGPFQNKDIRDKCIETLKNNYNVDNPFKSVEIQSKIRKIKLEKYGDEYFTNRDKAKNTMLLNYGFDNASNIREFVTKRENTLKESGWRINKTDEFKKYKNKVRQETNKYRNKLLETWDGYDHYDGEYIKINFNLHYNNKKYPTVDHKISIFYGFKNNISPSIIGNINNLCYTKRTINSSKNKFNSYERK